MRTPDSVTDVSQRKVLAIDDEPAFLGYLEQVLTRRGFRVQRAPDGRTGLALARRHAYDAIILDLRLPDIDGLDLLRTLRRESITVPVLVLSGYGTFELGAELTRLGASDCHSKPIRPAELIDVMNALVRRQELSAPPVVPVNPGQAGQLRLPSAPISVDVKSPALADLVALLDRPQAAAADDAPSISHVTGVLLTVLLEPSIDIGVWFACGRALALTRSRGRDPRTQLAEETRRLLQEAVSVTLKGNVHQKVRAAMDQLEAAGDKHTLLHEGELASDLRIDPAYLSHIIRRDTGLTFRQLRLCTRARPAIVDLLVTSEQVAQIAYKHGYQHPGHFSRDCRHLFRLSPTGLRGGAAQVRSVGSFSSALASQTKKAPQG